MGYGSTYDMRDSIITNEAADRRIGPIFLLK